MDERELPVAAILAVLVTLGFFAVLVVLLRRPEQNHDVLAVMFGSLTGGWTSIVGYYFGSSAGSTEKTGILAKLKGQNGN
jgi:hypothetical protein